MNPIMPAVRYLLAGLAFSLSSIPSPATAADKPVSREEIALGQKLYAQNQQQQGGIYRVDPSLNTYVQTIGMRLARVSDAPDLPYEFVVINNGDLNAWALPGGKIAINRGLLLALSNEAQLAAVLSHEIAHVTKRHGVRLQKKAAGVSVLGALIGLGIGMKAPEFRDLAMQGAGLLAYGAQANYSRDHELQADKVGMRMMSRAGYDPQAAVALQEIFVQQAQSQGKRHDALSALFSSHPPSLDRVNANRLTAQNLPAGMSNEAEYRRASLQLNKDKSAYQYLKDAGTAFNAKSYTQSLALVEKSIVLQPKEAEFWEMKGLTLDKLSRSTAAVEAFDRAIALNAGFYRPYLLRGMALHHAGRLSEAEQSINNAQKILPTQLGTYTLGEINERRGNRGAAAEYYRQAAQGGGDIGKAAQDRLRTL